MTRLDMTRCTGVILLDGEPCLALSRHAIELTIHVDDARHDQTPPPCHTYPDTMFGVLRQMLHETDPALHWESYGTAEKDHKVWVTWKGQTKAIGFVHELVALSQDKLEQLLAIYFDA